MFGVVAHPKDVERLEAALFTDHNFPNVDYITECDDSETVVGAVANHLRQLGFQVLYDSNLEAYVFDSGSAESLLECQKVHFAPKLERLRQKVASMPLHQFAADPSEPYQLVREIDDDYDDAVYFTPNPNGYPAFYTFDAWVRRLMPGKTYYLSDHALLMH